MLPAFILVAIFTNVSTILVLAPNGGGALQQVLSRTTRIYYLGFACAVSCAGAMFECRLRTADCCARV